DHVGHVPWWPGPDRGLGHLRPRIGRRRQRRSRIEGRHRPSIRGNGRCNAVFGETGDDHREHEGWPGCVRAQGGDRVKVGVLTPQGWKHEYDGWDPADAWGRTVELTHQAEELGFESVWVFDHFTTVPNPTEEITFESFTVLAALASITERVRLGHMVVCSGFRHPALVAKLTPTPAVVSGGRFELGIGAGWKRDEWDAYGYGFPPIGERMAAFGDSLEVITRMLAPGRATYAGEH